MAAMSASAADVKETYAKACAKCHGPDGKGDTKMGKKAEVKDFTDAKIQASFKDQDMIKAFLSHTPQEAFADRIGSWGMIRCFENLNRTCCRYTSE